MSISFDTAWSGRDLTHSSANFTSSAITIASANELLVGFMWDPNSGTGSMSFNGTPMVEVPTVSPFTFNGGRYRAFTLYNPSTGSHTGVATFSTSTNDHYFSLAAYKTVASSQPDNQSTNSNTTSTSIVGTVTTVADNCWTVMSAFTGTGGQAAGTGSTLRDSIIGTVWGVYDSNGAKTPAGSTTQTVTCTSGTNGVMMLSIAPLVVTTLYWIGGTGSWSDTAHWSLTTGGSSAGVLPDATVDCIFDGSSGGGTSTIDGSNSIKSLTMTAYTGTLAGSNTLSIATSLTLGASITNSYTGAITFTSTASGRTITSATKTFASNFIFNGVGGVWTLVDALTTTGSITLTNGTFATGNFNVSCGSLSSSNSNTRVLTLGSSTLTLTSSGTAWNTATTTGLTLNQGTSTIKFTDATSSSKTFSGGGLTYNNFYITGAGTGTYTIVGSNTFNDFKVDTPPHTVNFTASTTQSLQTFTVNGTAGNLMTLQSTSAGTQWKLHKTTAGTVVCDYLSLQDSAIV